MTCGRNRFDLRHYRLADGTDGVAAFLAAAGGDDTSRAEAVPSDLLAGLAAGTTARDAVGADPTHLPPPSSP